jgi:hypothetical protein
MTSCITAPRSGGLPTIQHSPVIVLGAEHKLPIVFGTYILADEVHLHRTFPRNKT